MPETNSRIPLEHISVGQKNGAHRKSNDIPYKVSKDPVTGLAEGMTMPARIHRYILKQRQKPNNRSIALLLVDLDRFRTVNRCLGHSAGDALLAETARRLMELAPSHSEIFRYSADEFYILLPDLEHTSELFALGQRILAAVSVPFRHEGQEILVGASIGISLYPDDGQDADALMIHAGVAMRKVKEKGGGFCSRFHPEMNQDFNRTFDIETDLRRALQENQLYLNYQPLVQLETGRLTGMEALIRWNHPVWGETGPSAFIPVAEQTGLIVSIGQWVLEEACRQFAEWREIDPGTWKLSVNVSVAQLLHPGFVRHVEETLRAYAMAPGSLMLEITESIAQGSCSSILEALEEIYKLGVEIAVDDFGTGYSSLSSLKRYPVHTLKLDRSLVQDAHRDPNSGAIIGALIAMARAIGIRTLAEGVETEAQHEFLKHQGCDDAQGYLYSRPVSASVMGSILQNYGNRLQPFGLSERIKVD